MRIGTCLLVILVSASAGLARQTKSDDEPKAVRQPAGEEQAAKNSASSSETKKRTGVDRLLKERIAEFKMEDISLEEAMEWLAERLDTTVYIRWQALVEAGFDRDKLISVKGRRLPVETVLWIIMQEFKGTSKTKLAYRATDDLFVFSTHDDLSQEMIVMLYDVKDLVMEIPNFKGGGGFGSSSDSRDRKRVISEPVHDSGYDSTGGRTKTRTREISANEDNLMRLIQTIKNTIEPDSWDVHGGDGVIEHYDEVLVVRASMYVHKMLGGLK